MRVCSVCGAEKPLSNFGPHSESAGGRRRQCRPCYNARFRTALSAAPEREQQTLARVRAWHTAHPDRVRAHKQKWQETRVRDDRMRAREAVKYAKRTGKLVPLPCEVCGSQSQAHHDDYTRPLDVRWLCPTHHKQYHKELS